MIISRTPFRISFFGGGTDYPAWYRQHGGAVLATTINKYCYISSRYLPPFFEHRFRIVYSRSEETLTVDDIAHPAVREVLRFLSLTRGIEVHHDGDLPARSGLGSSSAFTVGLLNALRALKGEISSPQGLADDGLTVEQERLKEAVGSQDVILAAFGGFRHVTFETSGRFLAAPVTLPRDRVRELTSHLMLFYTGLKRTAAEVAKSYDFTGSARELDRLGLMVQEAIGVLAGGGSLDPFGSLLDEAWRMKRALGKKVTTHAVDEIYDAARSAGALGGKLLGAGGGGFMLLFVPPAAQDAVRNRLSRLLHVPFAFEDAGSQIIFYDPEEDYSRADVDRQSRPIARFLENADAGGDWRHDT